MNDLHRVLLLIVISISKSHQGLIREEGTQGLHGAEERSLRTGAEEQKLRTGDSKVFNDSVFRGIESALYHKLICLNNGEDFYERGKPAKVEWVIPSPSTFRRQGNDLISESVSMRKDEDVYTCKVTWPDGVVLTRKIDLCISPSSVVRAPPVSISTSGAGYAKEGMDVELRCQAYVGAQKCGIGNHYDIVWSKLYDNGTREDVNGSENVDVSQETIDEHTVGSGKIKIRSVRPSDYGTYECRISNHYGSVAGNVTLTDKAPANRDQNLWILLCLLIFLSLTPCLIYGARHCNVDLAIFHRWLKYKFSASDHRYRYDVLIVHEPSSDRWVWNVLKPKLEEAFGYKCFFPVRDMQGGEYRYSCLAEIVGQCQSVMIVVTPRLIEDDECLYTIIQAAYMDQATTLLSKKMFPVILQPIKKEKSFCNQQHIKDIRYLNLNQQRVLNLLKKLNSVHVPKSCKMEYQRTDDKGQGKERDKEGDEDKPEDNNIKLQGPVTLGQHHQRVENIIIGLNGCSILSQDRNFKKPNISNEEETENLKNIRVSIKDGKTDARTQMERRLRQESKTKEQNLPDRPSSSAHIIYHEKTSQERFNKRAFLMKWLRVLFKGDDEQLFWKKVRLRLPSERAFQRDIGVV